MVVTNPAKNRRLILIFFLLVTTASTIFFGARRIAFYDFNYVANAVHRMSVGQLPYRDFDLVLPPVTFLPVFIFHQLLKIDIGIAIFLSAVLTQFISIIAFRSILESLFRKKLEEFENPAFLTLMVSAAVLNVVSIYPNYIYDSLATSLTLGAVALLLKYIHVNEYKYLVYSFVLSILSFLTKFNMGGSLILGICIVRTLNLAKKRNFKQMAIEASTLSVLCALAISLISVFGLGSFIDQTIVAPSKFKEVTSLGQLAQYNYPSLIVLMVLILISLKTVYIRARITRFTLIATGFGLGLNLIHTLFSSNSTETAIAKIFPSANFIFPIVMLIALHRLLVLGIMKHNDLSLILIVVPIYFFGTFFSQGWNGSSYSLSPLLLILLVAIYLSLAEIERRKSKVVFFTIFVLVGVNFLTLAMNGNRLGYVDNGGVRSQSFNWNTIGMASSKEDIDTANEVRVHIAQEQQFGSIVEFPAEDLLQQFSSTLIPWNRCLQFTFICPTKSTQEVLNDFSSDAPSFVILKKNTQINQDIEPIINSIKPILKSCFIESFSNRTYVVFKADAGVYTCIKKLSSVNYE